MPTSAQSGEGPQPPQPPEINRRLILRPSHAVGVALLLLIVVPALAGLFENKTDEIQHRYADGEIIVTYPSQLRIKNTGVLEVRLTGTASDSLRIELDDAYLAFFDSYAFADYLPSVSSRPAVWRFEYEAARIGRAAGEIEIAVGEEVTSFRIATTILP